MRVSKTTIIIQAPVNYLPSDSRGEIVNNTNAEKCCNCRIYGIAVVNQDLFANMGTLWVFTSNGGPLKLSASLCVRIVCRKEHN